VREWLLEHYSEEPFLLVELLFLGNSSFLAYTNAGIIEMLCEIESE
jgi:hypothetical protein